MCKEQQHFSIAKNSGHVHTTCVLKTKLVKRCSAQLATLDQILQTIVRQRLDPAPSVPTLRLWFKRAGIPRFKLNPGAKHGGGKVFYSVTAVEQWLSARIQN